MSAAAMIGAEWTKLRTVRATAWTPLVVVVGVVGFAVLVGLTRSLQPDDTIVGGSLTAGGTLGLLLAGVVGALVMATEHGTGMIASTTLACPRRGRVLVAKAVVVAAVMSAAGLASSVLAVVVGRVLLGDAGYAPGDPVPAVLGVAAVLALTGLLGLAVGSIVRHTGGAVAAILGLLLAPVLFAPLLGDLQRWVAGASPTGVLQKLAQSSDAVPATVGSLGAWPSLGVLASYAVLALMLAAFVLDRRDA